MRTLAYPDLQQQWLDHLQRQGKSQHTLRAYARGLKHFDRWYEMTYGASLAPDAVMPRDVRDWMAYQQAVEQAAPATSNQRLVALSQLLGWARAQGLCRENPAEAVSTIRLAPRQPKAVDTRTLRRLLRVARRHLRDYAILEFLAGTGLRVGELLALKVGDVELKERTGQVTVRRGKHENYRKVPLTLDVRKALAAYLDEQHPDQNNPWAPIQSGAQGGLHHRSSVTRMLEKYALQAGFEAVNPHALRHTFATRYLKANPDDLRGLARLLGHTVQIAGTGHAALELYDAHPSDLVLLDAMLPDMDGFAVCVELRKRSQVPIMMLTALSRYQDIIQGFGVGVDEYIIKPYLMGELIVRLRAVLRRGPSSNASILSVTPK